jgi:hypothetical protein
MELNQHGYNLHILFIVFISFFLGCKTHENKKLNENLFMILDNIKYEIIGNSYIKKIDNNTLSIYKIENEQLINVFEKTFDGYYSSNLSENGKYLVVQTNNELIVINTNTEKECIFSKTVYYNNIFIDNSGENLLTTNRINVENGELTLWEIKDTLNLLDKKTIPFFDYSILKVSNDFSIIGYFTKFDVRNLTENEIWSKNGNHLLPSKYNNLQSFKNEYYIHGNNIIFINDLNLCLYIDDNSNIKFKIKSSPYQLYLDESINTIYILYLSKYYGDFDQNAVFELYKINYLKSETTLNQTLNIENYYSKMILINPSGLINVFQKP